MSAPLAEGSSFAGRYRILRLIARGGMGEVYEVLHTETNRRRALKIMHPHVFESDELRERFKREARIAADIESEHIVDVFDAGIDEASLTPYLVMELLRGEELAKRLKRVGALPPQEALAYLRQTALALDKTHAAAIVHRDLKPENLFLTHRDDGSPRIKILDFGVAKVVAEGATGQGTQNLGTPLYMAPEQFHPGAKVTPAADIFAFGMVAYSLLVGIPYWRPESTTAGGLIPFITIAVLGPKQSPVFRASTQRITLPSEFDAWFFRATAFRPMHRFASAGEAMAALDKVFEGHLAQEVPTPLPPRPSTPSLHQTALTPGTFVPTALPAKSEPSVPLPSLDIEQPRKSRTREASLRILVPMAVFVGIAVGSVVYYSTQADEPAAGASTSMNAEPSSSISATTPAVEPSTPVAPPIPSEAVLVTTAGPSPSNSSDRDSPKLAPPARPAQPPSTTKPKTTKYKDLLEN